MKKAQLYSIPDNYCTISDAAQHLGVSTAKVRKFIKEDLLVWVQHKNSRKIYVETHSIVRMKYPDHPPKFEQLTVVDPIALQQEIDAARHRIASKAGLSPGSIKIFFDMG